MKPSTVHLVVFTVLLMLCASVVCSQQSVDETKIAQMRATVQKLEALIDDANIPLETREQLNELLFEKRGELHALLRQKRDALRSRLAGNVSTAESSSLNNTIRELNQEMKQLKGALTTASVSVETVQPQGSGSDTAVSSNAVTTETPAEPNRLNSPTQVPLVSGAPAIATAAPATSAAQPTNAQPTAAQPEAVQTGDASATQDACSNLPSDPAPPDVEYQRQITKVACRIYRARKGMGNRSDVQLTFQAINLVMALAIAREKLPKVAIPALTAQAEDASHSKNLGATESSSGGTSLVAKAGVPAILGFAVENGGLTSTASGTTVTFSGNPVGLVQAMAKQGFIESFQTQDDFTKFLRKLSFGVSFDTSRGDQPGIFTGNKQQLSGFSFKFNVLDQRDPRDSRHTARWLTITKKQASNLALSLNRFVDDIANQRMPGIDAWLVSANNALTGITDLNAIQSALAAELDNLAKLELTHDQRLTVEQVGTDFDAFLEERNDILDEIANGWIATVDYNNLRPVGTPSLSNFRLLVEKGAYNGSIDFTGNASLTFYNSRPTFPDAQTLRDFRFAGQLDVPIGDVTKTGKFLVSLGGRYQRLLEDELIPGTTVFVPKGDIAAFQAKLTIPIRGTAFKIPLSFTYANRTELIKEREIRGNFGFTFDLDSIFAKFNPFTQK